MALSNIFKTFTEKSPVTVMTQALIERVLDAKRLNKWFDDVSKDQYTRDLLFSSVFELMLHVVCCTKKSINEAFQHNEDNIAVSLTSVYNKINNISIETSSELVRDVAREISQIITELGGARPSLLYGYNVKMLDGNCIEGSDHRISELRNLKAGALPGKSLVVYDPSLGISVDVFPCEDGHAQERSLMPEVLDSVKKGDLWVADRNFCTIGTLCGIENKTAAYIIRQHKNLPFEELSKMKYSGKNASGKVYEQSILIKGYDGTESIVRRIKVVLKTAIRDGEKELYVLSNIPACEAKSKKIAELYRDRWKIETSFQHLEKNLNSEINSLGYPKAALFGFCVALVASNLVEAIFGSLRGVYDHETIDEEVSSYYIASELSSVHSGMMMIVPDADWKQISEMSNNKFVGFLINCAGNINLRTYRKHKRGPKKSPPEKVDVSSPHVSTFKLISKRKKKSIKSH
jgi:hypothetical protein